MKRVLLALTLASAGTATVAAQTPAERTDLARWTAAVLAHQPGTLSVTTREVGGWPWDRVRPVIEQVRQRGTSKTLLSGAAMYLDLAVQIPRDERPVYPTRGAGVFSKDGRPVGTHGLDPQIWWGRVLLVTALGRAGSGNVERDLASTWLRTVAAMFSQRLNFADLDPHLQDALKLLPDDPGLLFDAGCASETRASPLVQATIWSRVPQNLRSGGVWGRAPYRPAIFLAEAEQRYRASLATLPGERETRVRLGRVLTHEGRLEEALTELRAATRLPGNQVVDYLNWLFLGDVLADLRRFDEALPAFARAASLFPAAGSPHLGISRVLSEQGSLAAARAALAQVVRSADAAVGGDPRWHYDRCNGRNSQALYAAFAERFKQEWQ